MPKKAKSKAKSKAKLNRRAAPPKRRKVAVSIPALEAAATKAAEFAAKHEAAAAESKGAAEQRRSDADAARQEVTKLETAAKKAKRDAVSASPNCAGIRSDTLETNFRLVEALVPPKGFEPPTPALRMRCSTG